jgi:hypothetical protein
MVLVADITQPNGTELQILRIGGGVYLSESITDGGGEIIAGEGVIIDASNIDAVIAALVLAKRELAAAPLESAAA